MSQTTLGMYIHYFTSSQDAIEVDATYHQLLDARNYLSQECYETEMKFHMHKYSYVLVAYIASYIIYKGLNSFSYYYTVL